MIEDINLNKKNIDKNEEKILVSTFIEKEAVRVDSSQDIEGFTTRGYGTYKNEVLYLSFTEALYLLSKELIEVVYEKINKKLLFKELLDKARLFNKNAWFHYLIYRDLRQRGYVVREGFGFKIDFRVYKRGEYGKSPAEFLILGIKEGKPVSVENLAQILTRVQSLKKDLILAVLNRRGEIVYYSLSRLAFK